MQFICSFLLLCVSNVIAIGEVAQKLLVLEYLAHAINFFQMQSAMQKFLKEREQINAFKSKPLAANAMKKYITDLENEIAWSQQALNAAIMSVGGQIPS